MFKFELTIFVLIRQLRRTHSYSSQKTRTRIYSHSPLTHHLHSGKSEILLIMSLKFISNTSLLFCMDITNFSVKLIFLANFEVECRVSLSWNIRHFVIWPQIHKHQLHFCLPAFYLCSINFTIFVVLCMPRALPASTFSHA